MTPEDRLQEKLLAISDLARRYVDGEIVKTKMAIQLDELDRAWDAIADEIIAGTNKEEQ